MIAVLVTFGLLFGAVVAHYSHSRKKNFRTGLLKELKSHQSKRSLEACVASILSNRDGWKRSMSLIRKPFGKQVNLAIETVATLLALLGIVNGVTNFEKVFQSTIQGAAVLVFLAVVLAFIPSHWLLSSQIEKDMDSVLGEMQRAFDKGEMKAFVSKVSNSWPLK